MMINKEYNFPTIGITMGDYNGIGPEVVVKAVAACFDKFDANFVIIGAATVFHQINIKLNQLINPQPIRTIDELQTKQKNIFLLDICNNEKIDIHFGLLSKEAGLIAAKCLEKGIFLALDKKIQALITAPVSKEALSLAGYHYPGQTEMLADLTEANHFAMMLMTGNLRIGLVTTHCAISQIAQHITQENVYNKIKTIYRSLKNDFKIQTPKIAISSLNPHGGEGGLFGTEESDHIVPAIKQALSEQMLVSGPFPADTLFANIDHSDYDVYLAMYHDQGLIPIKMKSFGRGVNFTAGLPIIRTSPDHGTAFNIAGKMIANESSMIEAIKIGYQLAKKRITS